MTQTSTEGIEALRAAMGGSVITADPATWAFHRPVPPTPALLAAEREWVRSLWDALRPHMMGVGTYVNAFEEQERSPGPRDLRPQVRPASGHQGQI
jgi:hypothetical protein